MITKKVACGKLWRAEKFFKKFFVSKQEFLEVASNQPNGFVGGWMGEWFGKPPAFERKLLRRKTKAGGAAGV